MNLIRALTRVLTLTLLAVVGTSVLMYAAPGYFADTREMDAMHSAGARADLESMRRQQSSVSLLLRSEANGWLRGDLGRSRQYDIPVSGLLRERALCSGKLLLSGIAMGWCAALLLAIPLSMARHAGLDLAASLGTALLLAVPVGALATVCLVLDAGSPALVLGVLIGTRDFKLVHRVLRTLWGAPHLLYARAQGFSVARLLCAHVVPSAGRDVLSIGVTSFTLALSALVPVEVVFDRPGLGQLAWSAAMNRDLPVLVGVTALVAVCVGVAGALAGSSRSTEAEWCA